MKKTAGQIAAEVLESVKQSRSKQKRLLSSTFWRRFNVKHRTPGVIKRIEEAITEQKLKITVGGNVPLGEEDDHDWITLTLSIKDENPPGSEQMTVLRPSPKWFQTMETGEFESEREVEAFFLVPLLEGLGYQHEDIGMCYPVKMFKGVQRTFKEADIVVFNGVSREEGNVLLVVEAKMKSNKGINPDQIGQTKSYAQALFPACYIVSDGNQVKVFNFNGMLATDECVMDFSRSELREKWEEFYRCTSKEATCRRKEWIKGRFDSNGSLSLPSPSGQSFAPDKTGGLLKP